jgi:hypothetical protein
VRTKKKKNPKKKKKNQKKIRTTAQLQALRLTRASYQTEPQSNQINATTTHHWLRKKLFQSLAGFPKKSKIE